MEVWRLFENDCHFLRVITRLCNSREGADGPPAENAQLEVYENQRSALIELSIKNTNKRKGVLK